MKKKLLAILLAAIMVMTLVPTVAFADGDIVIDEVNLTVETDFSNLMMTVTAAPGEESEYSIRGDQFSIMFFDGEENALYYYNYNKGNPAWLDMASGDSISENKVDMDAASFIVWGCRLVASSGHVLDDSITVNVDGKPLSKVELEDEAEGNSTSFWREDDELFYIFIKQDLPKIPKAKIKGVIDAADFAYELIIPSETILTEDDHEDVLLGSGDKAGLVTIEVTKHGANNIDVFYKVDLENGNLTDGGDTTIDATYAYSDSATGTFTTLVDDTTEVTVYTGGEVKDSYVNVTADDTQWKAAPVGDYNGTVVFNFEQKTKCSVDPEVYSMLLKIVAIEDDNVYYAMYGYDDAFTLTDNKCESNTKDELAEGFGLTECAIGDCLHVNMENRDIVKCTSPEELGITDIVFSAPGEKGTDYYIVPVGTGYTISDGVLTIDTITLGDDSCTWKLNGDDAGISGTIPDGAAFTCVK